MNRRNAAQSVAIAILGFSWLPTDVMAQQQPLKDAILGTWSVTSIFDQYEDGTKENPWGSGMKGSFTFDGNGQFTQILIGEVAPAMKSSDPRRADSPSLAFIGAYTVDERGRAVDVRNERATNSIRDKAAQKWAVTGTGDTLTLIGVTPRKDLTGTFLPHIELKRAR